MIGACALAKFSGTIQVQLLILVKFVNSIYVCEQPHFDHVYQDRVLFSKSRFGYLLRFWKILRPFVDEL